MRFYFRVRLTSSILVTPDFDHTVKRYPVSWFSWTFNNRKRLRQAPGFLDRGPRPVVPSCRGGFQKRPNHTVENQIRPHRTETSPENYGLSTRPDHGFRGLLGNPLRGFKGKACLLVYSIALSKGFQTNPPPWTGRPTPYRSHGHHVSPPTWGRKTRLPVPRFISGEVTRRDEGPSSLQAIQKP